MKATEKNTSSIISAFESIGRGFGCQMLLLESQMRAPLLARVREQFQAVCDHWLKLGGNPCHQNNTDLQITVQECNGVFRVNDKRRFIVNFLKTWIHPRAARVRSRLPREQPAKRVRQKYVKRTLTSLPRS